MAMPERGAGYQSPIWLRRTWEEHAAFLQLPRMRPAHTRERCILLASQRGCMKKIGTEGTSAYHGDVWRVTQAESSFSREQLGVHHGRQSQAKSR